MFIYFDDAFVKKIADNTVNDDKNGFRTSLEVDGKSVRMYSFETHTELKEELKYPALTWKRYDRKYDITRYIHDPQSELFNTQDADGNVVSYQYDAPKPYNFFYQLELRAKSQYDIDTLELWLESHIDLRGDYVPIIIYIEETKQFGTINFPLDLVEYQIMDEEEDNNKRYRRIYSFKLSGLVDMNSFKSSTPQQIYITDGVAPLVMNIADDDNAV